MSFAPNERNVFPFELINRSAERSEVRYKSAIEIAETSELSYILDISWDGPLGYALELSCRGMTPPGLAGNPLASDLRRSRALSAFR